MICLERQQMNDLERMLDNSMVYCGRVPVETTTVRWQRYGMCDVLLVSARDSWGFGWDGSQVTWGF